MFSHSCEDLTIPFLVFHRVEAMEAMAVIDPTSRTGPTSLTGLTSRTDPIILDMDTAMAHMAIIRTQHNFLMVISMKKSKLIGSRH